MSGEQVPMHPFSIMSKLSPEFGYSAAFLSGKLTCTLTDSSATSAGGGKRADAITRKEVQDLESSTMAGDDLENRQILLKKIFNGHYDGPRISFIASFFLGDAAKPGISKADAVELLVRANVPFIPWPILKDHLEQGAQRIALKSSLAKLSWDAEYKAYCTRVPFNKEEAATEDPEAKSLKLAKAISFWQVGMATHNAKPHSKKVTFTDTDVAGLSSSQFSFSNGETPHPTRVEGELRAKLLFVQDSKRRDEQIKKAEELKRQAQEILDSVSEATPKPSRKKKQRHDSDSDSDPEQGLNALEFFLRVLRLKIANAQYIDFASMSTSRLAEIKMLNASSSKSSRISAGITFHHSLSESDVRLFTDDLGQIFDGFFFHYLKMVNESQLECPVKTVFDRISWWQWVSSNFVGNPAANVMFIKRFMVEHHGAAFWEPIVKNCHTLVMQCKEACSPAHHATPRPSPTPRPQTKPSAGGKGGSGGNNRSPHVPYTDAQRAKLATWRTKFPNTCLSRVVRGRLCPKENKNCKFSHTCAWCASTTCRATCSSAELL